jgi:hypothetical protein
VQNSGKPYSPERRKMNSESNDKKKKPRPGSMLSTGIAIGLAIGAGLGVALGNVTIGVAIGLEHRSSNRGRLVLAVGVADDM